MSEFPETLMIGQILTRELTKEIERRYNTYAELEERAVLNSAKAASVRRLHALTEQLAAKQAEVDALMLEYCPSEMSQEQRPTEWKTNDELRKQLAELLDWQQKAFAAHPNIDIDIDRMNGGN